MGSFRFEASRLEGFHAVIHLSGANVAGQRWSEAYKRNIAESRTRSTETLARALARLRQPPSVFISASAIGYYGNRGDEVLDEQSRQGEGFFPNVCAAWEASAQMASDAGIRLVHPRFGVVLSPKGGALARLRPIFGLGLGGKLGNGRQWTSWVSEADAIAALLFAVQHQSLRGPYNVTAPNPVTNAEFTRQMGAALHRPAFMAVPASALRLVFGQMADEALLASACVQPTALLQSGFIFEHPTLDLALASALA